MDHSEVKHFPKIDHTPAELDEASRLLLKAAAKLEREGWCQNAIDQGSRLCLIGALHWADTGLGRSYSDSGSDAWARLVRALPEGGCVRWNNAPERTKDEVVAKLRAVALGL